MTYAPDDLKAIQNYCHLQTGQDWASLGITHQTPQGGGYHEGFDLLAEAGRAPGPEYPYSDYSYADSNRDRCCVTDGASAFDLGGDFGRFREITMGIVHACERWDPRCRDVREVIYTPDGRTVHRWDATGRQPDSGDNSHLTHTHISFFRDSEGRRASTDNFLGLLIELFEGKKATQSEDDVINETMRKGDVLVLNSPTQTGGSGRVALAAAFGGAVFRLARHRTDMNSGKGGWSDSGSEKVSLADGASWRANLDDKDDILTVQHLDGAGVMAVTIMPTKPYSS